MTDDAEQRLSAALRAQAAGLGAGSPGATGSALPGTGASSPSARPPLPAWTVLVLAVLLGALAGGVAGTISVW